MTNTLHLSFDNLLGELSPQAFLDQYWQQKPLLIRQAIPDYACPISAEELAGLALEETVESRLVMEDKQSGWQCRYGPFEERDFTSLPESHWTLLVQGCNRYVPAFVELLQAFDFLPAWRLDDIMLSYAADQGSVGPHLDQYDVFLLQAEGQREWRINSQDHSQAAHLPGLELNILAQFDAEQTFLLNPGDMLYLPPGVAHYGIAKGPCMTVSVGFRAPNAGQLLTAFCDELLARDQSRLQALFYQDSKSSLELGLGNGWINPAALQQFQALLQPLLTQQLQNPHWVGLALTQSGLPPAPPSKAEDQQSLQQKLAGGARLMRDQGSRFAYATHQQGFMVYCNGEEFPCSEPQTLIDLLCGKQILTEQELQAFLPSTLLLQMLNLGLWYFDEDKDEDE